MTPGTSRPVVAALLIGTALATAGACTASLPVPPGSSGTHIAAPTVALPAPDARGPTVTVDGHVSWAGSPPGCVLAVLDGGQVFQLTGESVQIRLGQVRSGSAPPQQRLHLTGHVTAATATVCAASRSFAVDPEGLRVAP